ncbi:hypothetical protein [Kribbella qitaiheensis]|uniref:hypothetical protein n=1 Tax=Kribbella qitaiheensis TaxID=1544730 RepID=UPI001628A04C|nr:hypothetical protein [Kribbella qitaiheensis]
MTVTTRTEPGIALARVIAPDGCQRPARGSGASPRPIAHSTKAPSGPNSTPRRPRAGGKAKSSRR